MIDPQPADFREVPFSTLGSRLGFSYRWHGTAMQRSGWAWASAFCDHHPTPVIALFARLEGHDSPDMHSGPHPRDCTYRDRFDFVLPLR